MNEVVTGLVLGFLIGFGCRWFDVPVPAPPRLVGALLVVAMTIGYLATDWTLLRTTPVASDVVTGRNAP